MVRKRNVNDILYAYSLIQKGATRQAAADAIHASPSWLRTKFHAMGLFEAMNTARFDRDAAVADYVAGMSELAVSKKYGVDRCVINRELTKRGIKRRTGSEANYIRLGKMSAEERQALVASAHEARRGTHDRHEVLVKKAIMKESKSCFFGPGEDELYDLLRSAGLEPVRQKAADIYNIDLVIAGSVAVELTIGTTKYAGRSAKSLKRIKKLIECGYTVVTVSAKDIECFSFCSYKIVSDLQRICSDPSSGCKYWMIRCSSQGFETVRNEKGQFTSKRVPINFIYTLNKGQL